MRVSVDVSAVPAQPVGAGRYTVELVRALAGRDDVLLTLIARTDDGERWALAGDVVASVPISRPLRLAWEQAAMPRLLARIGVGVHHGPHYTMPERARIPTVVTIHDLTFFDHPEWHERTKVPLFRRAIATAARRAAALVCVSATTSRRLDAVRPPARGVRVEVIPHGVDHSQFRPAERGSALDIQDRALLGNAGIESPFVAFVGTIEPRKDVPSLIAAFDRIAEARSDLRLVLVGRDGWGAAAVGEAIAASPHRHRILRPGYLPDPAIPALLRCAAAVAYPSLEEGFGLPALEALACAAPLVTTSGSAMDEVVGDAALLVRPGNVSGLADAIVSLLDHPEGWRQAGPARAAAFTWEACAAAHAALYREVASGA